MSFANNIVNYLELGASKANQLEDSDERHEYFKNHVMGTKIVMDYPYIRRVKSAERFIPEKFVAKPDNNIRKTKSFSVKLFTSK
jgi:hypothetical protein